MTDEEEATPTPTRSHRWDTDGGGGGGGVGGWAGGGPLYLERAPSCRRPCDSSSTLGSLWRGGRRGVEGGGVQTNSIKCHYTPTIQGVEAGSEGGARWAGGAEL